MTSRITTFVRATRWRRRLVSIGVSLASHSVAVVVLVQVVAWLYPALNAAILWTGVSWLGLVTLYHFRHPGLTLQVADGALGLQDRLVTWWQVRSARNDEVTSWLAEDLTRSLEAVPEEQAGQLWRRPLRRLKWVIPLLILAWLIGPLGRLLYVPSAGGLTRPADQDRTAQKEPGEGAGAQGGGQAEQAPKPEPEQERPGGTQEPPPRPIPPLPGQEEFVIPRFIDSGPSRLDQSRVAVIDDPGGAGSGAQRSRGEQTPEERRLEFEAAAEQALRSRHLPASERVFVRRYFTELLKDRR